MFDGMVGETNAHDDAREIRGQGTNLIFFGVWAGAFAFAHAMWGFGWGVVLVFLAVAIAFALIGTYVLHLPMGRGSADYLRTRVGRAGGFASSASFVLMLVSWVLIDAGSGV